MEHLVEATLSIVSTIVTAIISYLMYRLQRHQENKDAEMEKHREAEVERIEQEKKKSEAIQASLLALIRDRILQGYRYYHGQGGISTQDLETMAKLYAAYHALGGNGTITTVYNKITNMPIKEE